MADILDTIIDRRVPGECVFTLHPEVERAVNPAEFSAAPVRHDAERARGTGLAPLDGVLARWGTTSLRRLALPAADRTRHADARMSREPVRRELAAPLALYRCRYDPARLSPDAAVRELLAQSTLVQDAWPNYYRATQAIPNDPLFPRQWGLGRINAPAAWDVEKGTAGITVAVLDTGCDMNHPDLQGIFVADTAADMVDVPPQSPAPEWRWEGDVTGRDNDPRDEVGHGTHVAGIIAGRAGNASHGAGVAGCSLMNVRVLGRLVHSSGRVIGFGTSFDITAGIVWAIDHGADIINMSFGFPDGSRDEREAIERAAASGVLPVAAMGNERSANRDLRPAFYRDTLAVGALDRSGGRWPQSQTGAHIDLVAPGVEIESTLPGGGFGPGTGTSMAAAFVSGVAALLRSHRPGLTVPQLRTLLQSTADTVGGGPRPNTEVGWGCVNAAAALHALLST